MDKNKLNTYTDFFFQGKLSAEKEKELLDWITLSEENRKCFLKEQEVIRENLLITQNPLVARKWEAVKRRVSSKNKHSVSRGIYIRIAAVAAAFIFGVLLTVIIERNFNLLNTQKAEIQNVTVPFGAKTNITLPDGSLVWLNSGSTLSFSSEFEDKRPVVLVGEAFFEVEKSDKPFIVSTNFGDVEVKGTSFNVKAYTEENTLQATLVSGSVLVREKDSKKEVTLEPGQQANLIDEEITLSNVETELFISWKDGKLIFRKEYLPAAIKRLERWYNVKIELADDKRLNEIWISGTLEMESFSEVLELLKVTSPIDYLYNEKTRTIKIFYKKK
ncbi:MAG: FecR family protein [Draconibacterium sp.]